MVVYKITNLVDGKCYVGRTKREIEQRFKEHQNANSCIGEAIRKYGAENFKIEVIEKCATANKLEIREKYWIKKLNTQFPNGYNLVSGRIGNPKYKKFPDLKKFINMKKINIWDVIRVTFAGKWTILILHELSLGAKKFNELKREIDITHSTLSSHLKLLVEEGLVHREVFPEVPPRVEYSLTEIGKSFQPVLDSIEVWGNEYIKFLKNRSEKTLRELK